MKNLYIAVSLCLTSFLFANVLIAQCDSASIENLANPGPFGVETLTEADGIRNGPDYSGATIYYPVNAMPPFPGIAIVPGFTATPSSVEEWGPYYASHGIVTIIIGTNSLFDSPEARAMALLDALATLEHENDRIASPLEGTLDTDRFAVSGWSMGGGGAQRAAVLDNTLKGVVALCPWLPNPQLNHQIPVLIFSGQADNIAPPAQHADIHYDSTPGSTDKLLFEVENGNHSIANTPNGGGGVVGQIALSWLKKYLNEDECYCPILTDELLANSSVASKIEQGFMCEVLDVSTPELVTGFYPNPTRNTVNFELQKDTNFRLFSSTGMRLLEGTLTGEIKQINLAAFPEGMYFLQIQGQTLKLVKHN